MVQVLIVAIYLFGCAAIGGTVGLFAGLPAGGFVGATLFLFALQMQAGHGARKHKRQAAREIANLKRANAAIELALHETHDAMEEMNKAIEARASAQGRKIVAELQVLESLMREFAGRISDKAKSETPPALEPRAGDGARTYLDTLGEPE